MAEKEYTNKFRVAVMVLLVFVMFAAVGVGIFQDYENKAHRIEMRESAEQRYGIEFPEVGRFERVVPTEDGGFTVVNNVSSVDGKVFERVKVIRDGDRFIVQVPESQDSETFVDLEPVQFSR